MDRSYKSSATHDTDPDTTAFRAGWPAWLGMLGGVWLVMSPFILGYFNNINALANQLLVGTLGFILSAFVAYMANRSHDKGTRQGAGWLLVISGIWLVASPFVLNYSGEPKAFTNYIITGVLFVIIALYGLFSHTKRFDKAISDEAV